MLELATVLLPFVHPAARPYDLLIDMKQHLDLALIPKAGAIFCPSLTESLAEDLEIFIVSLAQTMLLVGPSISRGDGRDLCRSFGIDVAS